MVMSLRAEAGKTKETWTWKRGPGACVFGESRGAKPPMERREAPAPSKGGAARRKDWCAIRRSIPSAYVEGKKKGPAKAGKGYGVPGAAKNTGDAARPRL